MKVKITDNSAKTKAEFEAAALRALEKCGLTAEAYAKKLCGGFKHPTGNLRNSISHKVVSNEKAVYVGSNVEYAAYVELGTGIYHPGGRKGWWVYVDGSTPSGKTGGGKTYTYEQAKQVVAILRSKGLDAHMTQGRKAQPYLKPAVADHAQTYRNIIESELKGG